MNKNLLKIYEGFFGDLDQLNKNQDDEFGGINSQVYDEHNYILWPYKNPEFFEGLCNMCEQYYPGLPSDRNGFTQKDLDKITYIDSDYNDYSYFKKVTSLDELQYFHNLKEINTFCFGNCQNLKSIIFPENLKKFWDSCFSHCTSLEKLNFPDSIKEIYNLSFYYCSSLKEIVIPKNIKNIGDFAFEHCSSLKEIVIPKRFKSLMKNIFSEVNLKKINITYI